jgi:SAM-dependent methyltransferase
VHPFAAAEVVARYEDWYDSAYGRVVDRIERALLEELLVPLGPGASLLEIGCGTAHFGAALRARGFRVSGVDPELAMLRVARERVPSVCGDGFRLPFRDGAFDGAYIVSVLDYVDDPVALLAEARRVARTRVALIAVASGSWLGLRRRVSGRLGHPIFCHACLRSREEIVAAARTACGEPERVRGALLLPPMLAGWLPRVEQRLSSGALPFAGIVGLALRGSRAYSAPPSSD